MGEPSAVAAETIAEIRESDVAAVAALHACCFDEAWQPALIGRITRAPGGIGLLWRSGDEPLGFVLGRTNNARAEVLSLGVTPAARRRGIGRVLMSAAIERASRRGLCELYLEVAEDNAAGAAPLPFYGVRSGPPPPRILYPGHRRSPWTRSRSAG